MDDALVIKLALDENRVLLTEDKDFGEPGRLRSRLPDAVVGLIGERGDALSDSFAVMTPARVRISRTPRGGSHGRGLER